MQWFCRLYLGIADSDKKKIMICLFIYMPLPIQIVSQMDQSDLYGDEKIHC